MLKNARVSFFLCSKKNITNEIEPDYGRYKRGSNIDAENAIVTLVILCRNIDYGCIKASLFSRATAKMMKSAGFRSGALRVSLFAQSKIVPSVAIVTTCQGIIFPLFRSALLTACSMPPQQGTSMRTTVTLWISLWRSISVSFSA